jgi:hypothetical protein
VGDDAIDLVARVVAIGQATAQLFLRQFASREQLKRVGVG